MLTTNQLRTKATDGTVFVGFDEENFCYLGMTEQANGDMAVELEYADAAGGKFVIEVSAQDRDEEFWDE